LEVAGRRRLDGQGAFRGDEIGPNPTDRAKNGTKRSVIVDAQGGPLGVALGGANVHDSKLLEATIEAIVVDRPDPKDVEQHLCLDKGYDNPTSDAAVTRHEYIGHTSRVRPDAHGPRRPGRRKARRWVVERTHAWLSKCRALLVRYDKKAINYLRLLRLACSLIWFRRVHQLGAT
jgi:putative transposase